MPYHEVSREDLYKTALEYHQWNQELYRKAYLTGEETSTYHSRMRDAECIMVYSYNPHGTSDNAMLPPQIIRRYEVMVDRLEERKAQTYTAVA